MKIAANRQHRQHQAPRDGGRHRHAFGVVVVMWVVCAVLIVGSLWPAVAQAQAKIYVPMITTATKPVDGSGDDPVDCGLNDREMAILAAMTLHQNQQRIKVVCNPIIAQVARARAKDMAERQYFSHTNPDGVGPNQLVRGAGYRLPEWYGSSLDANNIESIAAGYSSPEAAWQGWMSSIGHRTHLLGQHTFYAGQTEVGIGYYYLPDSPYGHYWVVLSAHPEDVFSAQELP